MDESAVVKRASVPAPNGALKNNVLKRSAVPVAVFLALFFFSLPVFAAQSLPFSLVAPFLSLAPMVLDAPDRQWLDKRKQLRVGISIADYEPIDITSDRNRYQGISADYLSLIGKKLAIPIQIVGFSTREEALAALRSGAVDMLSSATGYERGFSDLAFSTQYTPDRSVVVARSNSTGLPPGLQGKKVALIDGYMDQRVVQSAYPDSEIILAPNLYSGLEALSQGDVDVYIGNEVIVRTYNSLRPYMGVRIMFESALPSTGFSFALRKQDSHLQVLVNRALASLEPSVAREILGRWTVGLGSDVAQQRIHLSRGEQRWIRKHSHVLVASGQFPPYIYRDRNGQWVGLNVDLLARISRMTGLQFEHIEMQSTEDTIEALKAHRADMNTTLAENSERRKFLDFTYSFGGNSWVFVVRKDDTSYVSLADLEGHVLALPARHALEETIRREHPGIQLRLVSSYEEARQLVARGEADATIQNEASAYLYADDRIKVGRSVDGKWSPDTFSVIQSEPELLNILNKALEEFPVAELRAIRMKWLGALVPQTTLWQRIPFWIYWAIALAVLLGVVSVAWSSRLKVQIRHRLRAEEQLNDQLAFQRALLNGIPNPIYVRDLNGRLISCNRSYEQSFGLSFEQLNGRRLIDVDLIPHASAAQMHADYLKLLETEQPMFADRSIQLFDRRIEAWHWTVPFHRADGQLQGLLGGWIDISERKQLETQLNEARQQAEAANQAKSAFLASMSHDIRTPMTAIVGLLELETEQALMRGELPSHGLQVACQSARELIALIGGSLDLARIESGSLQLSSVATPLRAFFEGVCQLFDAQATEKGLLLSLDFAPQAEGVYWIDPLRLRQVLHNLLGNALKFTHQGAVRVRVERSDPDDALAPLHISVEDSGIGIDADRQQRLFQPFIQADDQTVVQYGGTGLGLSICRQLVELMGGSISLESTLGEGTCVLIVLPLTCVTQIEPGPIEPKSPRLSTPTLRLLVVDDLSANRMVLTRQLMFLGHEVVSTHDGESALALWAADDFDAVMTDCNMPGMSGYSLATAIREREAQEQRPACSIIGCTANAMSDERERCEQAGMNHLLLKPMALDQLAKLLAQVAAGQSFDIQTLRRMTQANEEQMQRMLMELWKNLNQEYQALHPAISELDWKAMGASLHRLKGAACLIDALPLARACAELGANVATQSADRLTERWQALEQSIERLRTDISTYLPALHF